jgi:hypothetical protein
MRNDVIFAARFENKENGKVREKERPEYKRSRINFSVTG